MTLPLKTNVDCYRQRQMTLPMCMASFNECDRIDASCRSVFLTVIALFFFFSVIFRVENIT